MTRKTAQTAPKPKSTRKSAPKTPPADKPAAELHPKTGPKSESAIVVEQRPKKADHGHSLTRVTTWVGRSGKTMGRYECQCSKWLEMYGDADTAVAAHARHTARALRPVESEAAAS